MTSGAGQGRAGFETAASLHQLDLTGVNVDRSVRVRLRENQVLGQDVAGSKGQRRRERISDARMTKHADVNLSFSGQFRRIDHAVIPMRFPWNA